MNGKHDLFCTYKYTCQDFSQKRNGDKTFGGKATFIRVKLYISYKLQVSSLGLNMLYNKDSCHRNAIYPPCYSSEHFLFQITLIILLCMCAWQARMMHALPFNSQMTSIRPQLVGSQFLIRCFSCTQCGRAGITIILLKLCIYIYRPTKGLIGVTLP